MSIGKNGNIDTIYNIGKMDKKNRSKSSLVAQRPSDENITSNEELTSINRITDSKENVNTIYNNSMQDNLNNTKYSIAGKKAMQNIVEYDKNNSSLKDNYYIAQSMQKNGVDNETIRKNTHWFQDKNGKWKFEFSDKDMSLKTNIKLQDGKTYKLGDILQHDALFIAYPELADYDVNITNLKKSNGRFNRINKKISLNNELLSKSKQAVEGTLIHEIQHAIQHIENFEGGMSAKFSKLAYYNSLGELEADDTKQRFISEKYKKEDISNVAPKASEQNPTHKNLEEYLNNRTNIDKFKDMIYPSVKKFFDKVGGNNEEIITEYVEKNTSQNRRLVDGRHRVLNDEFKNVKENLEEISNKSSLFDANLSRKEKQLKIILELYHKIKH